MRDSLAIALQGIAPQLKDLRPPLTGEELERLKAGVLKDRGSVHVPGGELQKIAEAFDYWHMLWQTYVELARGLPIPPELVDEKSWGAAQGRIQALAEDIKRMIPVALEGETVSRELTEDEVRQRLAVMLEELSVAILELFPEAPEIINTEGAERFIEHVKEQQEPKRIAGDEMDIVFQALDEVDELSAMAKEPIPLEFRSEMALKTRKHFIQNTLIATVRKITERQTAHA